MSVVLKRGDDAHILICKGAVEEVLAVCTRYATDAETGDLDPSHIAQAQETTAKLNADGFRVIAVAFKEMPPQQTTYSIADEAGLTLLGYIAFLDPPKETAAAAIATLEVARRAGENLTGDNDIVTRKICRDVSLPVDRIVLGHEVDALSPDAIGGARREHFGVRQGLAGAKGGASSMRCTARATSSAIWATASMTVRRSRPPTSASRSTPPSTSPRNPPTSSCWRRAWRCSATACIEGRKVFGNIIKYIKMGASSNFGNMFSVIGASIFLPFLPMAPIQVLTNNLLYDFSQTAIPTDNVDAEYLAVPRRWDIGSITKFVLLIGPISSIFDYVTFFVMLAVFQAWDKPALFQTGWFVESLLTQTLIIHIIRTAKVPFFESRASAPVIATSLIVAAIGIALPYSWLGGTLGFVPLPPTYWIYVSLILLSYAVLTHFIKTWCARRFGLS